MPCYYLWSKGSICRFSTKSRCRKQTCWSSYTIFQVIKLEKIYSQTICYQLLRKLGWGCTLTLSSILSYMNLQPDSGCECWTCKEHLWHWILLITSSSVVPPSCLCGSLATLLAFRTNCWVNLFTRVAKGVIRSPFVLAILLDDGLSVATGVNSELDGSPFGFACLVPGVWRNSSSFACVLPKSLQQLLLHYNFPWEWNKKSKVLCWQKCT
jgi:hypothetical protein